MKIEKKVKKRIYNGLIAIAFLASAIGGAINYRSCKKVDYSREFKFIESKRIIDSTYNTKRDSLKNEYETQIDSIKQHYSLLPH